MLVQYFFVFLAFIVSNFLYIKFFRLLIGGDRVPTGAGIVFSLILFISCFNLFLSDFATFACVATIFLSSLVYWLDDLIFLHPIQRMFIAISTSLVLYFIISNAVNLSEVILILLCCLTLLMMVFLVNVLNFYDGADLNLISLFFFLGLTLLCFDSSESHPLRLLGLFLITYSISFSIFNYRPRVLYLGDCGSFILASILIYIFITAILRTISWPVQIIPLIAFPAFDVLYVLVIRVRNNHNLLSRNYLHLYQRLNIRYKSYFYLLPSAVNIFLSILLIRFFSFFSNQLLFIAFLVSLVITPCTYLYFRYRFVESSFFFGDGTADVE